MKGIEFISDLTTILTKSRQSRDSRIQQSFLVSRTNTYRAEAIRQSHRRYPMVSPDWIQDMGPEKVTMLDKTEFNHVPSSGTKIGKFTIPSIVSLEYDLGINRITSLNTEQDYVIKSWNDFNLSFKADSTYIGHKFQKASRMGNMIYIFPFIHDIRAFLILFNPLDGYVVQTHTPVSGELIFTTPYRIGESYRVASGTITHNGIQYGIGNTFIAVNADYTGNGVLAFVNQKRKVTLEDDYPMSSDIAEEVFLKILTKDFQLEKREVADLRNDSSDELHIMQDQSAQLPRRN